MKASKWCIASLFKGEPKLSDFKLVEETLADLKENEILMEALFLSLDPYMRLFASQLKIGDTMPGEQVAKVVSSRHPSFSTGDVVMGMVGWRNKTVVDPDKCKVAKACDTANLPKSVTLSILGMPGLTAYHGLLTAGQLTGGETVFVNSSAGMVGATVGQIAKIKGCRVIGCAGSDDKCKLVKEKFGFDACFNYKSQDIAKALKHAAPDGIDFYYDNVGGSMSDEVISNHLKHGAKSLHCGAISVLNATAAPTSPSLYMTIISKELRLQGFTVYSHMHNNRQQVLQQLKTWIQEGKLKYEESIVKGFENMPTVFLDLLRGKYTGKVEIQI